MSVPVRRARKTKRNVENRKALYVEQPDIVTRRKEHRPFVGDVNKQTRSKRSGGLWEDSVMDTNEKTPLLDDVREKIEHRSGEQIAEAEKLARSAECLQKDTASTFTKTHKKPSVWRKCCGCCFRSGEEE